MPTTPRRLSGSDQLLIDSVCTRFEAAWPSDRAMTIEQCLTDVPAELRDDLLRELIALEIELRTIGGEPTKADEYLVRFPEQSDSVRQAFHESQGLAPLLDGATIADTSDSNTFPPTVVFPSPSGSAGAQHEVPVELPALSLPGYRVDGMLGRGGMGMVLRAWDEKLHRGVAIKVLLPQLASDGNFRQRFMNEARASAAIRHPNVVTIYAVEEQNSPPFLALELVEGITLAERLESSPPLSLDESLRIAIDLASGLAAAHAQGIVHRDIKPGNVLIESHDGRARLTDFGLARVTTAGGITTTGNIAGTPQFMSPEQIEGREVDARSDLFSLGAVLYRMISGQSAFAGNTIITLARQICDHTPPPVSKLRADVHRWLNEIIERLLAKKPEDRIQSAEELVRLLRQQGKEPKPQTKPTARVYFAAAVALLLVAVGLWSLFLKPNNQPNNNLLSTPSANAPTATATAKERRETELATQQTAPQSPFEWLTSPDYVWSEPENLGATINGPNDESLPSLTSDQKRLFFCGEQGTNFEAVRSADTEPFGKPTSWTNRLKYPFMSADGLTLLETNFDSVNHDLQMRHRQSFNAPWSEPIVLGPEINSPAMDRWPCLSPDGLSLTFASDRTPESKFDLWISRRASPTEPFGPAIRLGPAINTNDFERRGLILADGQTLVFHRNAALCVALMKPMSETNVIVLPDLPFTNGALENWFAPDGRTVYFSDTRPGGFGGKDIWLSRRVRRNSSPSTTTPPPPSAKSPFNAQQARAHQEAWAKHLGLLVEQTIELPNNESLTLVLIPPGEFLMGSPEAEQLRLTRANAKDPNPWFVNNLPSEGPQHLVRITRPFYLAKYELTQAQWLSLMDSNPSEHTVSLNQPVDHLNWQDAKDFLEKLNATARDARLTFLLPTEAQWEFACRAGTQSSFSFGDDDRELPKYGWFALNSGTPDEQNQIRDRQSHPVGELLPNDFGLHDMHGNVWEWCEDWFDSAYYASSPTEDPIGPLTGQQRVGRGGYAGFRSDYSRSAMRGHDDPQRRDFQGLRVAAIIRSRESNPAEASTTTIDDAAKNRDHEVAPRLVRELTDPKLKWDADTRVELGLDPDQKFATPELSADGLTLFFSAGQPPNGIDLFSASRADLNSPWMKAIALPINSPMEDRAPTISADGLTLIFASARLGGSGELDLWSTTRTRLTSEWSPPTNLGPTVNGSGPEDFPALSADGLLLAFSSWREGGHGSRDIWLTERSHPNAAWRTPRNAGPAINSAEHDLVQQLIGTPPVMVLTRHGNSWRTVWLCSQRRDQSWSEARQMPTLFDQRIEELCIAPDRRTAIFQTSRDGFDRSHLRIIQRSDD